MKILARQRFDPSADLRRDPRRRRTLGQIQKVFGQSLLRSTYRMYDAIGNETAIATEENQGVAILRRAVGFVPVIGEYANWLPIPYHFVFLRGEQVLGHHRRQLYKLQDTYTIDLSPDPSARWTGAWCWPLRSGWTPFRLDEQPDLSGHPRRADRRSRGLDPGEHRPADPERAALPGFRAAGVRLGLPRRRGQGPGDSSTGRRTRDGEDPHVDRLYKRLIEETISLLPAQGWQIKQSDLLDWVFGRVVRVPVHKLPLEAIGGGVPASWN